MHRHLARGIAAAALTTAALVVLPQAAFANQTAPGGGDSMSAAALVAPRTDAAALSPATAPGVSTPARTAQRTPVPLAKPPAPAPAVPATTGSDISYPQCSAAPPPNQLFGVIGVNGGTAKDFNPCLSAQFDWAAKTLGDAYQDKASLYINTANPGNQSSWWPTSNTDRPVTDPKAAGPTTPLPTAPVAYPDGSAVPCSATTDPYGPACAYVYGYVRAMQAVQYAKDVLGSRYRGTLRWWLDTETSNTWVGPTAANAASLAGAETALARTSSDAAVRVGIYSTTAQYQSIVGATGTAVPDLPDGEPSPLIGLPEWGAGASSQKGAQSNCSVPTFTAGTMNLTQYVSGAFDYDVSCRSY